MELNGYSFNLSDTGDSQLLEIVMQHKSSAQKVRDLRANPTEAVNMVEAAA